MGFRNRLAAVVLLTGALYAAPTFAGDRVVLMEEFTATW